MGGDANGSKLLEGSWKLFVENFIAVESSSYTGVNKKSLARKIYEEQLVTFKWRVIF